MAGASRETRAGVCRDVRAANFLNGIVTLLTDGVLLVVALTRIPSIPRLLPVARRALLAVVGLGVFVAMAGIVRLALSARLSEELEGDATWYPVVVLVWTVVELHLACIVAAAPLIGPLIVRVSGSFGRPIALYVPYSADEVTGAGAVPPPVGGNGAPSIRSHIGSIRSHLGSIRSHALSTRSGESIGVKLMNLGRLGRRKDDDENYVSGDWSDLDLDANGLKRSASTRSEASGIMKTSEVTLSWSSLEDERARQNV